MKNLLIAAILFVLASCSSTLKNENSKHDSSVKLGEVVSVVVENISLDCTALESGIAGDIIHVQNRVTKDFFLVKVLSDGTCEMTDLDHPRGNSIIDNMTPAELKGLFADSLDMNEIKLLNGDFTSVSSLRGSLGKPKEEGYRTSWTESTIDGEKVRETYEVYYLTYQAEDRGYIFQFKKGQIFAVISYPTRVKI